MEVSIIVIAYNEENYIKECLDAILHQSFIDFELIIVNDCSTDKTSQIIREFNDNRIKYIKHDRNYGIAISRNTGIKHALGKYVFFTDADCVPVRYWLEEGLRIFREKKCVGVQGRTFYATERTTISDIPSGISKEGYYATNNIAYTKEILDKVGNFNPRYRDAAEDLDIALRIKKYGEILFSENMIVVHQQKKYTVRSLFSSSKRAGCTVRFIKDHSYEYRQILWWKEMIWWRILYPKKLLILLFPFLLIPYHSFRTWRDIKLLPFIYLNAIYLRLILWKEAIKEKIFLI